MSSTTAFLPTAPEQDALTTALHVSFADEFHLADLFENDPDELVLEVGRMLDIAKIVQAVEHDDCLTLEMLEPFRDRLTEYRRFLVDGATAEWREYALPGLDRLLARMEA